MPTSHVPIRTTLGLLTAIASGDVAAATPDRVWGTYVGGGSEFSPAVAFDGAGAVYITGHTSADVGIATPGAHKTIRQATDGFLMKFDPGGTRLWGTYLGGTGSDQPIALAAVDGGVIVAGRTNSPDGIGTPEAHQPVAGGFLDGFLVRFDEGGTRTWGTYLGSNWDDYVTTIAVDAQGSLLVGGMAKGPLPGVGTAGTHQPVIGESGTEEEGFVARFDADGKVVWGTYYGGSRQDYVWSIAPGPGGAVYFAGSTVSDNNIASPGAHDDTLTKDDDGVDNVFDTYDAFLVRLTDTGARAWGTYLGGLGNDSLDGIVALPDGGVIVAGSTESKDGIATPGAFQPALASIESWHADGLLTRFDADGTRVWGTYFGGTSSDDLVAIARDPSGAILLLGVTASTGLATPDAFATAPGGTDALLARFTPDGARTWASYYGGEAIELYGGLAVAGDRIYISGSTHSATGIATPGAHLDQLPGPGTYGFLVRFSQGAGAPCDSPDACPSGLCVDGVCCDSPCAGDCQVCSAALGAAVDGECTPLAADVVCRPASAACDAAELCPGDAGQCPDDAALPDGDPCDDGVCIAGACAPASESTSDNTDTETTGTDTTGAMQPVPEDSTTSTTQPVPEDSTTAPEMTTAPGLTSDPAPDTSTGETTRGGTGDGGCGCRQTPGPGRTALLCLLVLAAARRRPRRPFANA